MRTHKEADLKTINYQLARYISGKGILAEDMLNKAVQACNDKGLHLGQALVQNHYLKMGDMVQIMRTITADQEPSLYDVPKVEESKTINENLAKKNETKASSETTEPEANGCKTPLPLGSSAPLASTEPEANGCKTPKNEHQLAGIPRTEERNLSGTRFANYQVLGEIARGGMGIVYRAQQLGIGRIVALKVLIGGSLSNASQVKRFMREAEVISRLNHPNIIPVYSTGEERGYHYFTMKYIEGGTFADLIGKDDVPQQQKLDIIIKICHALSYAHKHKILHRDIKPSNILIDKDGTPYLTDFGLAKMVDSKSVLTQTGTVLGTPFYMSPEQVKGNKYDLDHRSDIYAMGVILYQTLTRQLPFTAEMLSEMYRKIIDQEPVPPRKINPAIPENLEAICRMAMEKFQQLRYQDAQTMAQDLENCYRGERVKASKLQIKLALARFYRIYRSKIGLLVASISAIVLLVVAVYWIFKRSEDRELSQVIAQRETVELCNQAQELFSNGHHVRSLDLLEKAPVRLKRSELYLMLGRFYQSLEQFPKARDAFQKAYEKDTNAAHVLYYKSLFHLAVGEADKSLELIEAYIKKDPQSSEGYRLRASAWNKLGKQIEAQNDVSKANELEREQLQKQLDEIQREEKRGLTIQALEKLQVLLDKHQNYEQGYVVRADIYHKIGKYNQALKDISRSLELNPNNSYQLLKARLLYKSGYTKETLAHVQSVLGQMQGANEKTEMLILAGDAALQLEQYREAYEYYQKVFEHNAIKGMGHIKMGHAALEMGNLDSAERHLKKALAHPEILPIEQGEAYYHMGRIYNLKQETKKAETSWQKALELNAPQKEAVYFWLGKAYWERRDYPQAVSYLEKASQAYEQDPILHWNLGNCYQKMVKPTAKIKDEVLRVVTPQEQEDKKRHEAMNTEYRKKAVNAFSRCISLEPWQPEYYYQRALVYGDLRDYSRAEVDLLIYQHLRPESLEALVQIFNNMFEEGFVANYNKMNLLIQNYNLLISRSCIPDLFQEEWNDLTVKCSREQALLQKQIGQHKKWDTNEAQILLRGLIESNSPAVHEMAFTGLVTMYRESQLREMIKRELHGKKYLASTLRRLRNLEEKMDEKYFNDMKIHFRHLLVNRYRTYDPKALQKIYDYGRKGLDCLESLLTSSQEDAKIRYLAAQALCDLRTHAAFEILSRHTTLGDTTSRLFCTVVLQNNESNIVLPLTSFREAVSLQQPYARSIAVLHMPKIEQDTLQLFLRDEEIRIQLYAAYRLRKLGNKAAEKILLGGFSSSSPMIRAYAHAVYWNFGDLKESLPPANIQELKEMSLQHMPALIKALNDENVVVRQIAIARLAEIGPPDVGALLSGHLKEKDTRIRFQTLHSLAIRMELELLLPVLVDSKEPLPFRIAIIESLIEATKNSENRQIPTSLCMTLIGLLQDPEPKVRMGIVMATSKMIDQKSAKLVKGYLEQNQSDPAFRSGYILAIMANPHREVLPYLEATLDDKEANVQALAASASIHIAKKFELPDIQIIHNKIKNSTIAMQKAGAMGYIKLYLDRVKKNFKDKIEKPELFNVEILYPHFIDSVLTEVNEKPYKLEKFIDWLSCAIDLDSNNAKFWFERGVLRFVQKNYNDSLSDIEKAIELDSDTAFFKCWLARAYYATGQHGKVLKLIEEDSFIFHSTPDLCRLAAQIFQAYNRQEDALSWDADAVLLEKK